MTKLKKNKDGKINFIDVLLVLMLVLVVGVLISSVFSTIEMFKMRDEQDSAMPSKASRMSLTGFDMELAIEFMDKNHDGRCDVCGMPVEQCIDAGELQCNMGVNSQIGVLGSQHIHADWKIYINGKQLDFSDKSHMERMRNNMPVSSFIHVDSGAPAPEKTGDVLHMHASGVPLWIFFKSVGMDFNNGCITLENKEKFCNESNKKLKFFVNGKENNDFENYVFNDLDKILISYGDESEEEIKNQLAEITDFAKLH